MESVIFKKCNTLVGEGMSGRNYIRFVMCVCMFSLWGSTSAQYNTTYTATSSVPSVFMLGEHQESYQSLKSAYPTTLLALNNEDLTSAYADWVYVLNAIEAFADKVDFNLAGVKLWMHVYWKSDGSIDHIAYFIIGMH